MGGVVSICVNSGISILQNAQEIRELAKKNAEKMGKDFSGSGSGSYSRSNVSNSLPRSPRITPDGRRTLHKKASEEKAKKLGSVLTLNSETKYEDLIEHPLLKNIKEVYLKQDCWKSPLLPILTRCEHLEVIHIEGFNENDLHNPEHFFDELNTLGSIKKIIIADPIKFGSQIEINSVKHQRLGSIDKLTNLICRLESFTSIEFENCEIDDEDLQQLATKNLLELGFKNCQLIDKKDEKQIVEEHNNIKSSIKTCEDTKDVKLSLRICSPKDKKCCSHIAAMLELRILKFYQTPIESSLFGIYLPNNQISLKNLNHFQIGFCTKTDATFLEGIELLENLEHLDLAYCSKIVDNIFEKVKKIKNLKILDLRHCKINGKGFSNFESTLTELNLEYCNITADSFKNIKHHKYLQKVNIAYCKNLTDLEISDFFLLPSLSHLDISGCTNFTGEEITPEEVSENLRFLTMDACPKITSLGLANITVLNQIEELAIGGDMNSYNRIQYHNEELIDTNAFKTIKKMKNLRILSLHFYARALNDEVISEFNSNELTNLKSFNLVRCTGITVKSLIEHIPKMSISFLSILSSDIYPKNREFLSRITNSRNPFKNIVLEMHRLRILVICTEEHGPLVKRLIAARQHKASGDSKHFEPLKVHYATTLDIRNYKLLT